MPEIVPVELTLPSGTWITLHQRGWEDADDDSLAFLGGDDAVYAFATAEELSSYVISNDDHHLASSPLWPEVCAGALAGTSRPHRTTAST